MSTNPRRFRSAARLIVSVDVETIAAVDAIMAQGSHHQHRNRGRDRHPQVVEPVLHRLLSLGLLDPNAPSVQKSGPTKGLLKCQRRVAPHVAQVVRGDDVKRRPVRFDVSGGRCA